MYHEQSKTGLMQYVWPALRSGFASGHRVALVVHRAQKSVPDSAGERPTFSPPPLESCSGTANVDGPNWLDLLLCSIMVICHSTHMGLYMLPIWPIWVYPSARMYIYEIVGWIFSIWSSMELYKFVVVQRHGHMPFCPRWVCPGTKVHISETAGGI